MNRSTTWLELKERVESCIVHHHMMHVPVDLKIIIIIKS